MYYYPRFTYWLLSVTMLLFGYTKVAVLLTNLSLLFVLLTVIYWHVKCTISDRAAGVFTMLTLRLALHMTVYNVLVYDLMLDFPLMVTTTVAYCVLLTAVRKHVVTINICLYRGGVLRNSITDQVEGRNNISTAGPIVLPDIIAAATYGIIIIYSYVYVVRRMVVCSKYQTIIRRIHQRFS
jgi:hypothetical protein